MTLQQLKAFLAVVECGGFRAASRRLGMSQAGLTMSLKALETRWAFRCCAGPCRVSS